MCYTLMKADSTTCSSLISTDLVAASGVPSDLNHTTLMSRIKVPGPFQTGMLNSRYRGL